MSRTTSIYNDKPERDHISYRGRPLQGHVGPELEHPHQTDEHGGHRHGRFDRGLEPAVKAIIHNHNPERPYRKPRYGLSCLRMNTKSDAPMIDLRHQGPLLFQTAPTITCCRLPSSRYRMPTAGDWHRLDTRGDIVEPTGTITGTTTNGFPPSSLS